MPKAFVGFLRARNGLKDQIDRRAFFNDLNLVGNMGQYAGLRGNAVLIDDLIYQVIQFIRAGMLSVAGLIPITASPAPYSRPSSMDAAIPRASSVG